MSGESQGGIQRRLVRLWWLSLTTEGQRFGKVGNRPRRVTGCARWAARAPSAPCLAPYKLSSFATTTFAGVKLEVPTIRSVNVHYAYLQEAGGPISANRRGDNPGLHTIDGPELNEGRPKGGLVGS
ncbi:hypothetical protein Hypma_001331 [Hypsizygus marmoreus]|uniref:Uncharacterized protein n=1 Tax=Hypsizygus marmoreus TaxID=39966 RepID=A0A369K0M1_HYPMA|nr:hypothetical protein Hypma_001331 [Hypsizygus marmoreus]